MRDKQWLSNDEYIEWLKSGISQNERIIAMIASGESKGRSIAEMRGRLAENERWKAELVQRMARKKPRQLKLWE